MSEEPRRRAERSAAWAATLAAIQAPGTPIPDAWSDIFAPLAGSTVDDLLVVAQIGQSLDGRIATRTGDSHYINGPEGLDHLHRLRAVVDAVVIGVGTACADDPQLTVRRVPGTHPVRVVIDPNGRLPAGARILENTARCIVVRAKGVGASAPAGAETLELELEPENAKLDPKVILRALAEQGLRRILIEGGANTISCFLEARCLDRIHVVVAPVILGSGAPSFSLTPIDAVTQALRPPTRAHMLGCEVLFDCDLSDQRVVIGRAKKST